MTHKKESAGGFDTTTANTKHTSKIIAFCTRCKLAFIRLTQVLTSVLRRLA